jgi:Glyoxalase-like domain
MPPIAQLDHLVVLASTLDQGVQWCEATLGISPGAGGQHALMGTHNRLFKITSERYPQAYFEIIAVDPEAPAPSRRRWYDMDDAALRETVARSGPRLTHFVASVADARRAVASLHALGIERGDIVQASRATARGLLQWQITVRTDGQRLFDGGLPTLIQWGDTHPVQAMADSGVSLQQLQLSHPQAPELIAAYQAIGLQDVQVTAGAPRLSATLLCPNGLVDIHS